MPLLPAEAGESFEIDDEASLASVELGGETAEGGAEAGKEAKRESALQRWAREHEVDPETLHRFTFACQGNEKEAKQRLQQRAVGGTALLGCGHVLVASRSVLPVPMPLPALAAKGSKGLWL